MLKFIKKSNNSIWFGDFITWEIAQNISTGYDDKIILKKCTDSLLKVKNGVAVYERDSFLFDKIIYNWPLLAILQKTALQNNRLCVLDFGGSLGSHYFQNKDFLDLKGGLTWMVVEQPSFVNVGKQEFEDAQLKFFFSIQEAINYKYPDVVLLSSVLQYLEFPFQVLSEVFSFKPSFIVIDRTAFVEASKDIITIQKVPPTIYDASYPAWFFNKEKFLQQFKGYHLMAEFDSGYTKPTIVAGKKAWWSGFIFQKEDE